MFKPFSRSNPCPVCGEASPDCRYQPDGEVILCHGHIDFDPSHPDWHYVRPSDNGVWGVFVPRKDGWTDRSEWLEKKAKREAERLERERQRSLNALSIVDRDRAIRSLSQSLGLSQRHRQALLDRGLTIGQIETGLFFSIYPDDPVPADIPRNLPGVINGKIAAGGVGIACPAFDGQGRAIGWQLRLDEATDGDKYRWAGSQKTIPSNLPNGELPTSIIISSADKSRLWLCEGILKPFVSASKHGIACLGASGGHFLGSPQQVKDAIANYQELVIVPDAGDIANPKVMKRWKKQIEFIKTLGKPVKVAWWGQKTKDDDDIDELESLDQVGFITISQFLDMGKIPSQSSESKKKTSDWEKWEKLHTFTPQEIINQQYLDIDPPKKGEILIVNSPTNTGKSTLLKKWASNEFKELGVIRIGNRNSLELQFCNESDFYHLQSEKDLSDTLLSDPKKRISFCFPSLVHTESRDWENTVTYGDEIDGTIQQSLFLNKDPDNLDRFVEALDKCDQAVFLSGTIYDHHVEYLRELCPSKTFRIVQNIYQPRRPEIKLLAGTFKEENPEKINSRDKSPLLDRVLSDREPIMIQSDSKHFLNSLERLLKDIPDTDTLLVTADTLTTDKNVKLFIENPNEYIRYYCVKNPNRRLVVFASPTMTSGNDITVKYFKRDYHYYCGQLSSVLISQKTIRIRDVECERILSIPEFITSDDNERCEYLEQWQNSIDLAQINLLDEPGDDAELIKLINKGHKCPHNIQASFLRWIRNFERKNLRECVIKLLTQQGYEIELVTSEKSEQRNEKKLKEVSNEIKDEISEAIYQASDKYIDKDERSIEPITTDDLRAVDKAKIINQLPSIQHSQAWSTELIRLVKFDNPRLIQQLNRRYLLHHPETLKQITAAKYHRHGKRISEGKTASLWKDKNDLLFMTAIEKIKIPIPTGKQIGFKEWIDYAIAEEDQFSHDSPVVKAIVKQCQSKTISQALGRFPGKDSIKFVSWLLGYFGYRLKSKRVRVGKAHEHRYKIKESCDRPLILLDVQNAIARRYEKISSKCTNLDWSFLDEKPDVKIESIEMPTNSDTVSDLPVPDHGISFKEGIGESGTNMYYSDRGDQGDRCLYRKSQPVSANGHDCYFWGYQKGDRIIAHSKIFTVDSGMEKNGDAVIRAIAPDGNFYEFRTWEIVAAG